MSALLFIIGITVSSVFISLQLASEVSWFTYYLGGVVGLFLSSVVLKCNNELRERKLDALEKIFKVVRNT